MRIDSSASTANVVNNPTSEQSIAIKNEKQKRATPTEQRAVVLFQQEKVAEGTEQQFAEEQVITAIEKANDRIQFYNTHLEFSIHEKTKEIMVKVYRDEEVIREIPPEKVLDMVAHMLELAGLLVDETV